MGLLARSDGQTEDTGSSYGLVSINLTIIVSIADEKADFLSLFCDRRTVIGSLEIPWLNDDHGLTVRFVSFSQTSKISWNKNPLTSVLHFEPGNWSAEKSRMQRSLLRSATT